MTSVTTPAQKIRRVFSSVPADVREWTRFFSNLLYSRQWTTYLSGCTTQPAVTITYTVAAGVAVLNIPTVTGTSNLGIATFPNMPNELVPARDQVCMARIWDNSVLAFGTITIEEGILDLTLGVGVSGGLFTAAGTKGVENTTICFGLD